ncbi:hypothetical protein SAY86_030065 [Trapa natans]|uniref:Uncharacterized protein n=1 Tax=Trapa natans TaxID=22666 RepID=A0AAN7M370_TRANT|nr:hypothetical protein SAY86_030065 [Trapa natans]
MVSRRRSIELSVLACMFSYAKRRKVVPQLKSHAGNQAMFQVQQPPQTATVKVLLVENYDTTQSCSLCSALELQL